MGSICWLNGVAKNLTCNLRWYQKDMLLSAEADADRTRRFENLKDLGLCAFADAFELTTDQLTERKVRQLYRKAHFAPSTDQTLCKRMAQLDLAMKNRLKRAQDAVCDSAIPNGLYVGFPENNLQLMVHVGAKGGMVNAQQMSVALGQIELEGRRVPLMLSGRSLPSFPPYDVRPRAGGMCTHRFLTSLPPQELFFHSMAGRDGLVDTAVKTSRSGYLQRSAIKHLEDLSIQYDGTVRDSGKNIIQFRYGDDGIDVCQSSFLQQAGLNLFADNAALFNHRWHSSTGEEDPARARLIEQSPLPRPLQMVADQVGVQRQMLIHESMPHRKIARLIRKAHQAKVMFDETAEKQKKLSEYQLLNDTLPPPPCSAAAELRQLCVAKLISAQAPPGDPVGLLAAQSVGEPSTQMTLNTFHFAGRGEMNVTLGIPRLREILMSGSSQTSTPCMEVPVRPSAAAHRSCMQIAKRMYKLKLVEAIQLPISERVDYASDSCTLHFQLLPRSAYAERSLVKPARVLRFLERVLFSDLARRLDRELRDQGKTTLIRSFALAALARQQRIGSSALDGAGADGDANEMEPGTTKTRARDEWNEDDGHEAVRRRRMEAEAEDEPGGHLSRGQIIDLDEAIGINDEAEDDAEAAELRELGVDPEYVRDEDDEISENETNDRAVGGSKSNKPRLVPNKSQTLGKAAVVGPPNMKDDTGLLDDVEEHVDEDDVEQPLEDVDVENGNKAAVDLELEAESRCTFVTRLHARFSRYDFDRSKTPTWARLTICMFDPKEGRISIDLKTLVTRIVNRSVVSSVPGIEKVVVDKSNQSEWMYRVEGVNMIEMMRYPDVFDLSRLYTNNICVMNQTYGIEAARAAIQKEVSSVFGHYGIYVNPRHLSLIADYMTKSGCYRAFNRMSFRAHPSPLQQMSFETVTSALKATIQDDRTDPLVSPSASLVVGRLVQNCGTNCFDLFQKLQC
ncbi:DNA-directed RNA polymerase subunit [Fasciola gigantica]|uniref:DNA-directed RNA polymerase n=1 Tax=Fasciola gigantica TaxID=46835 RepID=A0A504YFM4_FASGI|nr:DNA-directed RNA polymerase subunit [Fasciola gigantica]